MALALGAKLSLVVVKQVSKPIALLVKREAKAHPMLAYPLEVAGGMTHRLTINLSRLVLGKVALSRGSIATVAPLTKEHAVDLGAELLGESIIFSIVGGTVAYEVFRQVRRAKSRARHPHRLAPLTFRVPPVADPRLAEPLETDIRAEGGRKRATTVGGACTHSCKGATMSFLALISHSARHHRPRVPQAVRKANLERDEMRRDIDQLKEQLAQLQLATQSGRHRWW